MIMEDHATFLLSALSSKEQELITKLKYYKEVFKNISENIKLEVNANRDISTSFINNIITILIEFIDLKRIIMKKLLLIT
jgi:hypothetical protein